MENLKELRSMRAEQVDVAEKAVEAGKPEEAQDALEEIKKLDERISAIEEEIKELTDKEKGSKDEESNKEQTEERSNNQQGETRMSQFKPAVKQETESKEVRGFMEFLRSKGEVRENVKSEGVDVIIPKDIVTQPIELPETVTSLKDYTNVVKVPTAQGTQPILESPDTVMHSVEELAKNPELAAPKFKGVDYKVQTYRGQIPIN